MVTCRGARRGFVIGIAVLNAAAAVAADWPHWRGPARDGATTEHSGWDGAKWLAEKPAWEARVGEGASSPLVVVGRGGAVLSGTF